MGADRDRRAAGKAGTMADYPDAMGFVREADRGDRTVADRVVLGYEDRFLRRKRLVTEGGRRVLVNLPETVSAEAGDCFELMDGRLIVVEAAAEPVLEVRGDLPRLAWHIGNRHTPCEIAADHLVIREDHVLKAMLVQLGAAVTHAMSPFRPEGGAYGHGRTMGHDHGHGHVPHVFALGHAHGPVSVQTHSFRRVEDEPEVSEE